MPVAEFPGRSAGATTASTCSPRSTATARPTTSAGSSTAPTRLGLAVILDVVYNHLGPDGNYLAEFSDDYFSKRHKTEWGEALNFDGENAGPVREFVLANAAYWIDEFHLDGLRLDATQSIFDDRVRDHILGGDRPARCARRPGAGGVLVVGENEPQHARLLRPAEQGGLRPRHALERRLPPRRDGRRHRAAARRTTATTAARRRSSSRLLKRGLLYQGQWNLRQGKRRGSPAFDLAAGRVRHLPPEPRPGRQLGRGASGSHALTDPGAATGR